MAQWVTNPTSIQENVGSIPGLTQWVKDLVLQWHRPAALIQSLAWELPYAAGAALKSRKKRYKRTCSKNKLRDFKTNLTVIIGEIIVRRKELGGWE